MDPTEGTCTQGSPRDSCIDAGGEWLSEENGIPAQCRFGCCNINTDSASGSTQFVTETTCNVIRERTGYSTSWDSSVNELECIISAKIVHTMVMIMKSLFFPQHTIGISNF